MGKRFFGRVDRVPGLFYVATAFIHLFWFPLIPLGTSIVLENSERAGPGGSTTYRVHKTGFSFKSFLIAYFRAVLIFPIVFAIVIPAAAYFGLLAEKFAPVPDPAYWGTVLGIVFGGSLLVWLSHKITAPSKKRALELGKIAGYPDEAVLRLLNIR